MVERNLDWTVLDRKYLSRHQYFTARVDRCERPDGHIVPEYYVVELPPSVCMVPVTQDGMVLMVRQYRHPLGEAILEIPGGFVDPGEDPTRAARRELLEETGYAFEHIELLGKTAANPGLLNNFTHLFLARGGYKAQAQHLDANEEIEIVPLPLETVRGMLFRGRSCNPCTRCAYFMLFRNWGD